MRIAIDGAAIGPERSGARTRLVCLLRAYAALERRHEIVVFARADSRLAEAFAGYEIEVVTVPPPPAPLSRWLETASRLSAQLDRARADAFQCETLPVPPATGRPLIVTIHDLRDLYPPAPMFSARRAYARWILPRALARAACEVAVSEFTRGALIDRAGARADRVHVVKNAADPDLRRVLHHVDAAVLAGARERLRLPPRFVLALGHLERRKNLAVLAAAVRALASEARFSDVGLVLAGADRERLAGPLRSIAPDRVVVTGAVSDADRAALCSLAACLAIPSLHEGFGIVPLEAMSAGCPVVAADAGALPEVCGDAALWFDPRDAGELRTRLSELLSDATRAASLREAGAARAARFTWPDAARALLAAHDAVLAPVRIADR